MRADSSIDRRHFLNRGLLGTGLAFSGVLSAAKIDSNSSAVVETATGKVRGTLQGRVSAFKGVPYGASTAGAGRFMPPSKPQSWPGIRDAVELGARSPQGMGGAPPEWQAMDRNEPMSEDCLFLNVWTPGVGRGKRPVMVFLHGGGYATGSGGHAAYDGSGLAGKHDVVAVTINHRLNAFGYLYLAHLGDGKYANSSNLGMQDIVAALAWVRDNIAAFGGDSGNVTIYGQSGGAGKVCTLLAMPSAKGLFHRAIQQSGSNLRGVPREAAGKGAEAFLARLGLKPNQVDELQKMPVDRILESMRGTGGRGQAGRGEGGPAIPLSPVVDGKTLPANPFDPTAPEYSASVPLLIGSNATELTFFGAPLDPIDEADMHRRVMQTLRTDDAGAQRAIAAYRKSRPDKSPLDVFQEIAADSFARMNAITETERKLAAGKAPVYLYYFAWRSPAKEGKLKAGHCMEIPFVMDVVDACTSYVGSGPERQALATKMSGAWAAFARSGNPNHKGLPHWDSYTAEQRATMKFDNECRAENDPRREERLALSSLTRA